MAKKKYRAVERIDHNQKVYEPGEMVPLEDDQAAPLLALRHISDPDAEAAGDAAQQSGNDGAQG